MLQKACVLLQFSDWDWRVRGRGEWGVEARNALGPKSDFENHPQVIKKPYKK